jgi:hypothetical protein
MSLDGAAGSFLDRCSVAIHVSLRSLYSAGTEEGHVGRLLSRPA